MMSLAFIKVLHFFHTLQTGGAQIMRLRLIKESLQKNKNLQHFIISFQDGELRKLAEELKIPVFILSTNYNFLYFLPRLLWLPVLINQVKKIGPDIIHSLPWLPNFVSRCILVFFVKHDCKIINDFHGTAYLSAIHHWLDKKTYHLASLWIFVNKDLYNFFFKKKWNVPAFFYSKGLVVPNFVNKKEFMFIPKIRLLMQKKFNFNEQNIVLCFVGRLDKIKRISFLLDLFKFAQNENLILKKNLKLLICGSGPEENNLQIKALNLNINNIHFLGNLNSLEILNIYNLSDALILCSESEGSPTVVLEALANGLLILLSENLKKSWHKKTESIKFFLDQYSLLNILKSLMIKNKKEKRKGLFGNFQRALSSFYYK